jgi:hypothetical protein
MTPPVSTKYKGLLTLVEQITNSGAVRKVVPMAAALSFQEWLVHFGAVRCRYAEAMNT